MILKLKADSAVSTAIAMREAIILDRLNRLFGTENFKKLDIVQGYNDTNKAVKQIKTLSHHKIDLPDIEDPVLKSRLESLGQAVMNSAPQDKG